MPFKEDCSLEDLECFTKAIEDNKKYMLECQSAANNYLNSEANKNEEVRKSIYEFFEKPGIESYHGITSKLRHYDETAGKERSAVVMAGWELDASDYEIREGIGKVTNINPETSSGKEKADKLVELICIKNKDQIQQERVALAQSKGKGVGVFNLEKQKDSTALSGSPSSPRSMSSGVGVGEF
ncbi:hypothetical protein FACS1894152_1390 [Bacilli bacterium]|nr:hypothetical protein FACS1894152_1390 [Bacilli bacterium]